MMTSCIPVMWYGPVYGPGVQSHPWTPYILRKRPTSILYDIHKV